ncbi:Hypothetical predicted protein, partial [Paramuricea clavata]
MQQKFLTNERNRKNHMKGVINKQQERERKAKKVREKLYVELEGSIVHVDETYSSEGNSEDEDWGGEQQDERSGTQAEDSTDEFYESSAGRAHLYNIHNSSKDFYREKKSCDPVRDRASRNREEFKMLMREMLHQMPPDICLNALCVEKTLTLLLKQWKSCQNPAFSKKFEDIGCSTFYMFIDMVSDSVRQFPPTMQFFSTCVELLGKTFIMENRTQTEVLLRTILARPKIVGLLLPIFQPSTCEDSFTEMYENVIQTNLDVEVKFSLLSKFDFRSWLVSKPTLSERMAMMKVLFAALCDCGLEPPVKTTMLSE